MKVKVSVLAPVAIFLALLPTAVSANMGSPLLLASTLHLLFGNGVIGYIEALIITKVFGTSLVTTGNLMMLAN